jgi:hypothetical protein
MHYRAPNTIESALEADVAMVGGQDEAARIVKHSQKHISNCLNPYKKDSLDVADLLLLCREIRAMGKVPESAKFIAQEFGVMDGLISIAEAEEDVKQLTATIHRISRRGKPVESTEEARA